MNDRFKFRVWGKHKGYDVDGNFILDPDGILGEWDSTITYEGNEYIIEQCTGLKDRNGNLIYEGDVVIKTDYNALGYTRIRKCNVYWDEKCCLWAIMTEYGDGYPLSDFEPQQYEIIGNIHEQPEQKDK